MESRAMIVVGAGASSRFEGDKLMTPIAGVPLVAHTVRAVRGSVDRCVVVCREDQRERIAAMGLDVSLVEGGPTRTASEMAGLSALEDAYRLIGIHDAARPLVSADLIERLFAAADEHGGAIPVVAPAGTVIDRATLSPMRVMAAQTPQVFRSEVLRAAFEAAAPHEFSGYDTAAVVTRFAETSVMAVPGEAGNLKVTYPEDVEAVEDLIRDFARSEPR